MPARRLLIDNDAFILLAGAGLLDDTISALGFDKSNAFRVHELPFVLGRNQRIRRSHPPDNITRAQIECENCPSLAQIGAPPPEIVDTLRKVPGIDPTDAVLLALAASDESFFLLTGDKRAVVALATNVELRHIRDKFKRRIVCLEKILRLLVETKTASAVGELLLPYRTIHKSIAIFFSDGNRHDDAKCLVAIDAYYSSLTAEVGADLLF